MKLLRRFWFALCMTFAVGTHAQAEVIKFGTLAPLNSPWYDILREMADDWQKASGGTIQVKIYPGGVAGDESDIIRKMRVGQLQAATLSGGLADIAPEFRAFSLPMLFDTYEELDYVVERKLPELNAILETRGFKALNWADIGWLYFFTQRPAVHPNDLRAQRLFWWESGSAYIEAWKDAGFHPVPLAATDMHTALQSGLINAFAAPPLAALSFQWFALAPHMTDVKWASIVGATVISTSTWRSIPDPLKPRFAQAARDAGVKLRLSIRPLGDEAVKVMQRHGLTVHPVPPDVKEEWRRGARAAYPKIVGQAMPRAMVADVERLVAEHRAKRAGN